MRPKDAPHAPTDTRTALVGLSRAELAAELASLGEKAFRTKQVWHWLYHRGAKTFAEMTDLGKELRAPAMTDDARKALFGQTSASVQAGEHKK